MPFGHIYNLILKVRAAMYRKGIAHSHDLGVPVISVGNITVGGTGKTPLVAFVAKVLAENAKNNCKVCILTRGYKRENPNERVVVSDGKTVLVDAKKSGDEPFELAQDLLGIAAVIADKDRASAATWAKENLGSEAFILDDGFQHFKLKRSLDLVTIDATNPFGNGWLLPQGTLREPVGNLARADAVILTRSDLAEDPDEIRKRIRAYVPHKPLFISRNKTSAIIPLSGLFAGSTENPTAVPAPEKASEKALASCALGNPAGFFRQLEREGFNVVKTRSFPDHHAYTQKDAAALEELARQNSAEILLTTIKDAVKLKDLNFSIPCFVVKSELVFDDEKGLRDLIAKALT